MNLEFHNQDVIRPVSDPIKSTGHITILRGSLAPDSAVAKLTGKEGLKFEVRTQPIVFVARDTENDAGHREMFRYVSEDLLTTEVWLHKAVREDDFYPVLTEGQIPAGTAVIFRYQGPKGAPGMPEVE